jgi:hypothetical protein
MPRFHCPLIEPEVQLSRIRIRFLGPHAKPEGWKAKTQRGVGENLEIGVDRALLHRRLLRDALDIQELGVMPGGHLQEPRGPSRRNVFVGGTNSRVNARGM